MSILKMLDLSTGHITENDGERLLKDIENFPGQIVSHEYGWMIPVIRERYAKKEIKKLMSATFYKIYLHALNNNCDWINFDQDAEQLDNFKLIDW